MEGFGLGREGDPQAATMGGSEVSRRSKSRKQTGLRLGLGLGLGMAQRDQRQLPQALSARSNTSNNNRGRTTLRSTSTHRQNPKQQFRTHSLGRLTPLPKMPGTTKAMQNARTAAFRAHHQRVYISGLKGEHSLETGVAYHYRGHFIYAYPAGNPIEPVPFSTKKGINIIGTTQESAPLYIANAPGLRDESEIRALDSSIRWHEWEREIVEEEARREVREAVEEEEALEAEEEDKGVIEMSIISRPKPGLRTVHKEVETMGMTPLIPSQVSSRGVSRATSQAASRVVSRATSHVALDLLGSGGVRWSAEDLRSTTRPGLVSRTSASSRGECVPLNYADRLRSLERYPSDPGSTAQAANVRLSRPGSLDLRSGQPSLAAGPGPTLVSSAPRNTSTISLADLERRFGAGMSAVTRESSPVLTRSSTRAVSHVSLADLDGRFGIGGSPSAMGPGPALVSSASRAASYTALSNLAVQDHRSTHRAPSPGTELRFPRTSIRGRSVPSLAALNVSGSSTRSGGYQFGSTDSLFNPGYNAHSFLNPNNYTPHDRALYLADSAPGSRLPSVTNTPDPSRPVSPVLHRSMRQVASSSRLRQLLAEDRGIPRAFTPLSEVLEGASHSSSATLNDRDGEDEADDEDSSSDPIGESWLPPIQMSAFIAVISRPTTPAATLTSPPHSRNKPIGTGRPRRASMALNQAHNAAKMLEKPQGSAAVVDARVAKCPIHSEECDGVTVTETWRTRHAQEKMGFAEPVPVMKGEGEERAMVDWARLLREEKEWRRGLEDS